MGEYTSKARRKKEIRTVQFRKKDTLFFKFDASRMLVCLARNATDKEMLSADAATMHTSNHKNGIRGA